MVRKLVEDLKDRAKASKGRAATAANITALRTEVQELADIIDTILAMVE